MTTRTTNLLLVPGFMLDGAMWDALEAFLPASWILTRASLQGDTIPAMARRIVDQAPQRFILVGFSLGGYIARQIAADFPDRVESLVIIASSLREDTERQAEEKRRAVQAMSASTFRGLSRRTVAPSLHSSRSQDTELIEQIRAMSQRLGYESFARQSGLRRSGVPAASIQCPTLVIGSPEDKLRSSEEVKEVADTISGSVLRWIDHCGHMIPLEQPQILADLLIDWVEGKASN